MSQVYPFVKRMSPGVVGLLHTICFHVTAVAVVWAALVRVSAERPALYVTLMLRWTALQVNMSSIAGKEAYAGK